MFRNIIKNVSTLVVVGKWNIHIFSPEWVKNNVFGGEDMNVEVALPVGPYQFSNEQFKLTVSSNRIHFEMLSVNEDTEITVVSVLRTILRLLNQTPVSAFGFNYVFETDAELNRYFLDFGEDKEQNNPFEKVTIKREVRWSFIDESEKSMNVQLHEAPENSFRIVVNCDYPINNCLDIMSYIDDDEIISHKRKECETFITNKLNINKEN